MDSYLEECRPLSLNARMGIAALVFEQFCEKNQIRTPLVPKLLDYLWKWPLIDGPEQFESWENARPMLVNYGLGDKASAQLLSALADTRVSESLFRTIVESLIEILWGNFWGGADDQQSFQLFRTVLMTCELHDLPPLAPFRFSLFLEGNGWGAKLTKEDRDVWRRGYTVRANPLSKGV